jgi:hypothetical protein
MDVTTSHARQITTVTQPCVRTGAWHPSLRMHHAVLRARTRAPMACVRWGGYNAPAEASPATVVAGVLSMAGVTRRMESISSPHGRFSKKKLDVAVLPVATCRATQKSIQRAHWFQHLDGVSSSSFTHLRVATDARVQVARATLEHPQDIEEGQASCGVVCGVHPARGFVCGQELHGQRGSRLGEDRLQASRIVSTPKVRGELAAHTGAQHLLATSVGNGSHAPQVCCAVHRALPRCPSPGSHASTAGGGAAGRFHHTNRSCARRPEMKAPIFGRGSGSATPLSTPSRMHTNAPTQTHTR